MERDALLEKTLFLLRCRLETDGEACACLDRRLNQMPVFAAIVGLDGHMIYRNKRQRSRPLPPVWLEKEYAAEVYQTGDEPVWYRVTRGEEETLFFVGAEVQQEVFRAPMEEALTESARLTDIVDNSPIVTLMAIPQHRHDVLFVSANVERYGYVRDRFYEGRLSWLDLVHPDDRTGYLDDMRRFMAAFVRFSHQYRIRTVDGHVCTIQADMTVMRDEQGVARYYEGTVTDVTAQAELAKELEQKVAESEGRMKRILGFGEQELDDRALWELAPDSMLRRHLIQISQQYGVYSALVNRQGEIVLEPVESPEFDGVGDAELKQIRAELCQTVRGADDEPFTVIRCPETGLVYGLLALHHGGVSLGHCFFGQVRSGDVDEALIARTAERRSMNARTLARSVRKCTATTLGSFGETCEIESLNLNSYFEASAKTLSLLRQVEETRVTRKMADRDYTGQLLVNRLISRLYDAPSMDEAISEILALVGESLRFSHTCLYEPDAEGRMHMTHEWSNGDMLRLPAQARLVSDLNQLLPDKRSMQVIAAENSPLLEQIGALRACNAPVVHNGEICGVISLIECVPTINWSRDRFDVYGNIFRVLSCACVWKTTRERAALSVESLGGVLENLNSLVYVMDYHTQNLLFANTSLLDVLGEDRSCIGKPIWTVLNVQKDDEAHSSDADGAGEMFLYGRWYKSTSSVISWIDGRKAQIVCLYDIHDIKTKELQIEFAANHDALLGVFNRRKFEVDLREALKHAEVMPGALVLLDLDDFKYINDAFGHDKGDEVLKRFVHVLLTVFVDDVYRYGGDEFMVLLRGVDATELRELINLALQMLRAGGEDDVGCTASIGIARFPQDGHDVHDILRSVDMAMYTAKREGKGTAVFFTSRMDVAVPRTISLEQRLREEVALGCPNFELEYQPVFGTTGGKIDSAEALLRWYLPGVGTVMPDEFIGMAEMLGLVHTVGTFVLERAVRDILTLRRNGLDIIVSANLFIRQMQSDRLAERVLQVLKQAGCPAQNLMLEITEDMSLYDHRRKVSQFAKLKEMGVLVCADKFGTGQSSPANLREGLWNVIKFDREVVRKMLADPYYRAFVRTRIKVAHAAGVNTCAEGVEVDEQRALLAAFECDYFQGHLIDAAMPLPDLIQKYARKG